MRGDMKKKRRVEKFKVRSTDVKTPGAFGRKKKAKIRKAWFA
jgi:hypothetical protein